MLQARKNEVNSLGNEFATRTDLKNSINDLKEDIEKFRNELKEDIASLRNDLNESKNDLRGFKITILKWVITMFVVATTIIMLVGVGLMIKFL